jgi:methyl-coenzyme M reductase subunit D
MTDATYPQVRIVTERLMYPETVERLLNIIAGTEGIRKILMNGPHLPTTVPYGPARGKPNPLAMKRQIRVGDQEVELQVQVGTVTLELENRDVIPAIRAACDLAFKDLMAYTIQEGRFMKSEPTLSDYAKYGPDADKMILGLVDPKSKSGPVILQGTK